MNNIDKMVNLALANISARQKEVIVNRYGLQSGEPMTLAEIGDSYNVTRERIRQIEAQALNVIHNQFQSGALDSFIKTTSSYLGKYNNVRRHETLSEELKNLSDKSAVKNHEQKVRFLLEASRKISFYPEDNDFYSFWHLTNGDLDKTNSFIAKLVSSMRSQKGKTISTKHDAITGNFISISKKFSSNVYGDFGLSEWQEINPKVSRDWAYLVLKKEAKPTHFLKLAGLINERRSNKRVNPQTIHNELIKDGRFVLVGRGTYGLKEFNIVAGTAQEVLAHLLTKHGSLNAKDLIKLVIAQRDFKEKTLLLSLRNKKYFNITSEGKYTVKEA